MEQLIIKPLEEWYETIELRTTNFENYNMCPFKYKFEPKKKEDYEPYVFGRKVHTICQWYLLARRAVVGDDDIKYNNKLKDKLIEMIYRQYPNGIVAKAATPKTPETIHTHVRFRTYLNILDEYYQNENFMIAEFAVWLEVHVGKYKIIISWSLDLLTTKYCIIDLKTASKPWTDESVKDKLQKLIYLYAMYRLTWKKDIRFEYAILRTDLKRENNVKLQTVKTHLDIDAMEYVLIDLCQKFVYSTEHNVWQTRQWDHCWFCLLWPKHTKQCPLFDKPPITWMNEENT